MNLRPWPVVVPGRKPLSADVLLNGSYLRSGSRSSPSASAIETLGFIHNKETVPPASRAFRSKAATRTLPPPEPTGSRQHAAQSGCLRSFALKRYEPKTHDLRKGGIRLDYGLRVSLRPADALTSRMLVEFGRAAPHIPYETASSMASTPTVVRTSAFRGVVTRLTSPPRKALFLCESFA